jgi:hypothetical protein
MSKYIDEIIDSLKHRPNEWRCRENHELYKGKIEITGHGNSIMLSIIDVKINGIDFLTTWRDRAKLERAVSKWYTQFDLTTVTGEQP